MTSWIFLSLLCLIELLLHTIWFSISINTSYISSQLCGLSHTEHLSSDCLLRVKDCTNVLYTPVHVNCTHILRLLNGDKICFMSFSKIILFIFGYKIMLIFLYFDFLLIFCLYKNISTWIGYVASVKNLLEEVYVDSQIKTDISREV